MKLIHQIRKTAIALLGIAVFALPAIAGLNAPDSLRPLGLFSKDDDAKITGKVEAKSATTLTVNGKVLMVTEATAILKNSSKIKIDDLQVGDSVQVTTVKDTSGALLAVNVVVTSAGRTSSSG